jgi:8-oxo-dGTP diphosphatase
MHIPYTICFIHQNGKILMQHRKKQPNKGKWNGIGGKIEIGETPLASCIREVKEETGLLLHDIQFRGVVSWNETEGMYVYTASKIEGTLRANLEEGMVQWKSLDWIYNTDEVVSNIPYFLDEILSQNPPLEHKCFYDPEGRLIRYETTSLSKELLYLGSQEILV